MLKKTLLVIILIVFSFSLSGCYRLTTINSLRQVYKRQEWNGELEINNVILIGKVKETLKFPVKRYFLSSGGEYIWILVPEGKTSPKDNTKVMVIGTAKRFLLIGDVCLEEKARYPFARVLILFLLSIVIISILVIWIIILAKKKRYHAEELDETNGL